MGRCKGVNHGVYFHRSLRNTQTVRFWRFVTTGKMQMVDQVLEKLRWSECHRSFLNFIVIFHCSYITFLVVILIFLRDNDHKYLSPPVLLDIWYSSQVNSRPFSPFCLISPLLSPIELSSMPQAWKIDRYLIFACLSTYAALVHQDALSIPKQN